MKNCLLFWWLNFFGLFGFVHAQPPPIGYRHLTADDGLPSSEVHEMLQDGQGYLWFATDNGVSRFNGYEFENFGALQGLKDPVVFHLQEDSRGRVWMKCMSGLLYYFENDSLRAFAGNTVMESLKGRKMGLGNFYVDSLGQVFNSIYLHGLIRFLSAGKREFLMKENQGYAVFLVEKTAVHTLPDVLSQNSQAHTSWDQLTAKNLWQLTLYTNQDTSQHILPGGKAGFEVESLLLQDSTLIVARARYLFGFKKGKLVWQLPIPEPVAACFQNARGEVYLGFIHRKGVRYYRSVSDLQANRFETFLEGYSVTGILEDRQGGYWFSTTEAGVFYRPKSSMETFDQASGLPHNYITAVDLKNENEAFVGMEGGGMAKVDARAKKTSLLPHLGDKILDIAYDPTQKALWAIGENGNAHFFLHGKWHLMIDSVASAKRKTQVGYVGRHFHFSSDRRILWAAFHYGFNKINPSSRTAEAIYRELHQETPYNIRTLDAYTTADNRTWIANIDGLFELRNNQLLPPEQRHPAFQARVEALAELPDSTLVIGSKGFGLIFWKKDRTASMTIDDGLTANMIENLHVDVNGILWAGTLNGLNKVQWRWDEQPEIERITTVHGLPSNEVTDVATWGNVVWVGTTKGLARFVAVKPNSISPKPILASVKTNLRSLDLASLRPVSFWENNITIHFFAINYKMAGHIPYRYRLDGGNWTYTTNTSLNLPAMSPGERLFEVQVQNEDGVWSEPLFFQITILPPWWQSWWFWSLVTVAMAALIWVFIHYRTSQIRHEAQLKTAFQQKILETEMAALRSQMNPHFIFNCLNSINHFVVTKESDLAASYISKFSRLIRLVLDNSRSQRVSLENELEALRLYMELESMRFDGKFRYELWVDDEVDTRFVQIPSMLIQPYVENAIWHGLMHKPEGGSVIVDVKLPEANLLRVEITDDGIGRDRAAQLESKSSLSHKPQGATITADRLKILDNNYQNNGRVIIQDLLEMDGQPCGTKVVLEIPL